MITTFKKSVLFSATCLQPLALVGGAAAMLAAVPAFAQDADPQADVTEDDGNAIVVTGSLIQNPNLVQANPVNVTTADQIELKQSNTAEEVLREIPGIVANIGNAVNNGNGGNSYVDLRGLGSNRNIVLLDGNRMVPADLAGRVDLNNIPLALISRVDALTGAAVTTYGADAITGVVNFVTKKDFAGVDISLGNQITEEGDGNYFRADMTIGANFDDGRGNAVLSVGYQESDPVFQGDRDFSAFNVSSFSGTFGGSGTSIPSRFSGTRPIIGGTINRTPAFTQTGVDAMGRPILTADPAGSGNGGVRQVDAAGAAVPTFARFNFAPFNVFQVPFKRYNIFAQANYEASDNVEVYTRGLFTKNQVKTIIAPSGSFGGTVDINLNNPFLPAALRNQFCAFNIAPNVTGVSPAGASVAGQVAFTPRFDQATCDAAALATSATDPRFRTVTATLNRRTPEVGSRISDFRTTIFDYRIGARGAITDTINWDVSGAYGESENVSAIQNYTLQSRFRQASLANGTRANPVCTVTTGGCVPVDLFGPEGSITPTAAAFLSADSTTIVRTTLAQARAVINGDLGITLGADVEPVGFALGAEYRNYGAQQASDTLAKTSGELGGAGGAAPDIDGGYDVYEAYGELVIPVLDILTLEAGARYSKYQVEGGGKSNTFTYKGGVTFEPVDGLRFRGNYARAVRAPNISELFTPNNTVLTSLGTDPCSGAAPVGNANLRAICLAQGAPAGTIGSILNPTAAQANITTAGNLNLDPEKATTYTFGVVFQPTFIPRFSISADYYNIKVKDVIGAPLPGDLISACFGGITAASAASRDCTVIRRNPFTGGLDGDPSITGGLFAPLDNQGRLFTDGIDVVANYQTDLGFAEWAINFTGNYTFNSKFKATPTSLNRECVGFYSSNCSFTGSLQPKYQLSLRNTFTVDNVDLSFLWRHIDGFRQEPDDIANGNGPTFAGTLPATGGNAFLNGRDVNFQRIKSYNIFDATMRFNVNENITFTLSAQNLLDKNPPLVGTGVSGSTFNGGNTYPSTYDSVGRRYAVGARLRF